MSVQHQPNSDSERALARTLERLGISDALDSEVLACSPPDLKGNGETYKVVNDDLEDLVSAGPVDVTHITGEARALVDPAHRRVLRRVHEQGASAVLGCHFQTDDRVSARSFLAKQRHHWDRAEWYDLVDLLALAGDGIVQIRVMDTLAPVHFSVFSSDRVLMQDEHHHPTKEKWVWYLRSRGLAERLRPIAERALEDSVALRGDDCRDLLRWLYGYEVYAVLCSVGYGVEVDDDVDDPDVVAAELTELGFLARAGETTELSRLGRQWLDEYQEGD